MLTLLQKLYFAIFINFHYGTNLPDEMIRHIIDFVKYDKLKNETIYQAVRNYCLIPTDNKKLCKKFTVLYIYGPINYWDVSNVTRLFQTFKDLENFNEDISEWDVSQVTAMYETFKNAKSFQGDLSGWDVSNVITMYGMFDGATSFNGDLSGWNVSNVGFMENMFQNASSFNGDLIEWNVSNVQTMDYMFCGASSFNKNISEWCVGKVRFMRKMFSGAKSFSFGAELNGWRDKIKFNLYCGQMFDDSGINKKDIPLWYTEIIHTVQNSHLNRTWN